MGEVYRAFDTRLGRDVAIKILPKAFTRDPERLARFEREARVLASLNHPNIATIHGVEEAGGIRYLVLEFVDGVTLRSKLDGGALPKKTLVRLAAQIAAGLAKAHAAGIVHRDLKPDNLMITEDGFIKILDFGLAKAIDEPNEPSPLTPAAEAVKTATGRIMGTSSYMSPEQARGEVLDHRSDQFSFGSVLHEMAAGVRAFARPTDADTLVAIMRSEPERPEDFDARVPQPLREIIGRCLSKQPADRYESTSDLAHDLRGLIERLSEVDGSTSKGTRPLPKRKKRLMAAGAAVTVVAVMATTFLWRQSEDRREGERVAPVGTTASIAVLPLENLGPAQEEYFADGLTDALITHLAKIKALKVISRSSVMRYRDTEMSVYEIASELGVETVLTGTVLHAGDRVRISTQLTDAASGRSLWAESYERDLGDILELQGQVARAIAGAVKVEVSAEEEARIVTAKNIDPEAHEAYLMGLADLEAAFHGEAYGWDLFRAAVGHFQQAIEIEPEWGEPYAEIAGAYDWLSAFGGPDVQAEFYPKAKQTALEALALDDTLSKAHSVLGDVLLAREWDWAAAEQANQRALELDPNHASWDYARFLRYAGRYQEAIEQYTRARERYPTSPLLRFRVGRIQLCAGRSEEAETEAERLIEDFPESDHGYYLLGLTYFATSRYEEAATILERARDEVAPWMPLFRSQVLPLALVKAGHVEEARRILRELETSGLDYWLADLYVALGEEDKAMDQIEAAFAVRRDVLLTIRCSPEFEQLMKIPRFREIIDAIGFPN